MSVQCELGWSGFMKMREEVETVNMSNFFQQLCCKGENKMRQYGWRKVGVKRRFDIFLKDFSFKRKIGEIQNVCIPIRSGKS